MFSTAQFNNVFKNLKTRLGVDEEGGVEGVGKGVEGGVVPGSSGATTPNGVAPPPDSSSASSAAAAAATNGAAINGTSAASGDGGGDGGGGGGGGGGGEGGDSQPKLSAFETTRNYKYLPRLELRSPSRVVNSIKERLGVVTNSSGVTSQTNGEATGAALSSNTLQSQSGTESSDSEQVANQHSVFGNMTNHAASDGHPGTKEEWDEGVSWQKVKDRLTGERVKSLFAPSRFSLSGWGAKQPDAQQNGDLPDLSDPELHKAAITIQAAFKFYKHSKRHRDEQDLAHIEEQEQDQDEQQKASSLSKEDRADIEAIDMADPKLHDAAARIQATFKGHRFRKSAGDQTAQVRAAKAAAMMVNNIKKEEEEEVDIDLKDPKTAEAAAQIQAAFRGMQIRKKKPTAAAVASTNPFAPSPAKTAPPKPAPARPPASRPPPTSSSSSSSDRAGGGPSRTAAPPQRPPSATTAARPPGVPARPPRPGPPK